MDRAFFDQIGADRSKGIPENTTAPGAYYQSSCGSEEYNDDIDSHLPDGNDQDPEERVFAFLTDIDDNSLTQNRPVILDWLCRMAQEIGPDRFRGMIEDFRASNRHAASKIFLLFEAFKRSGGS